MGCEGLKLCTWEVHYSHCSKLGQNRPYYERSEIPCPVLPFSKSMHCVSVRLLTHVKLVSNINVYIYIVSLVIKCVIGGL
jgi:hypothetical protein